jgi:DNA gyrase subunit A
MFVTKQGIAKKTSLEEYLKTKKKSGVAAINLKEDDELASVFLVKDEDIVILTEQGYGIKIKSSDIGASARVTMGVKGIDLRQEDKVSVALPVHNENDNLAVFLRGGTGKKFGLSELPLQKRAGKGVIITKPQNNADYLISATLVEDSDNILIIGDSKSVCISASEIPALSRGKSIGNQMIKDSAIKVVSKV